MHSSFPGVLKHGSALPTRPPCVFIYSTFAYAAAAGPDLWAWSGRGHPCALLPVSPLIWVRVKDLAWAEGRMEGSGGADGVTECLGTCHFMSALASTSGLLSLWPPAKYDWLTGLDHRAGKATFNLPPYTQLWSSWCPSLLPALASHQRAHSLQRLLRKHAQSKNTHIIYFSFRPSIPGSATTLDLVMSSGYDFIFLCYHLKNITFLFF